MEREDFLFIFYFLFEEREAIFFLLITTYMCTIFTPFPSPLPPSNSSMITLLSLTFTIPHYFLLNSWPLLYLSLSLSLSLTTAHSVLLICTCIWGWPCGIEWLSGGLSLKKNDSTFFSSHWLPDTPHVGEGALWNCSCPHWCVNIFRSCLCNCVVEILWVWRLCHV